MPPQPLAAPEHEVDKAKDGDVKPKQLPKGVVLGPDGKPCRSCTSFGAWAKMTKDQNSSSKSSIQATPAAAAVATQPPPGCPPDVEQLGRSTWTLLHTMAANYPERPSPVQQAETSTFMGLFGKMYPCWVCADDFQTWMKSGNAPRVSNRTEFAQWLCEAHNEVNVKLGKPSFDCNKWDERWRSGWKDGSCG